MEPQSNSRSSIFYKEVIISLACLIFLGAVGTFAYYVIAPNFGNSTSVNSIGGFYAKQLDYFASHNVSGGSGTLAENFSIETTDGESVSVAINAKGGYNAIEDTGSADVSVNMNGSGKQFAAVPPGTFPLDISFSLIKTQESLYVSVTKIPTFISTLTPQLSSVYQEGTWVQVPKMFLDLFTQGFMKGFNNSRALSLNSTSTLTSYSDILNLVKSNMETSLVSICGKASSFENWSTKSPSDKKAFADAIDHCLDGAVVLSEVSSTGGNKTMSVTFNADKYLAFMKKYNQVLCKGYGFDSQSCMASTNQLSSLSPEDVNAIYKNFHYTITLGDSDVIKGINMNISLAGDQMKALMEKSISKQPLNPSSTILKSMVISFDGSFDLNPPVKAVAPASFISIEELVMKYQAMMSTPTFSKPASTGASPSK